MKTNTGADVSKVLRKLRWRMRVRQSLDALGAGALAAAGLLLLAGCWSTLQRSGPPVTLLGVVLAAAIAAGAAVFTFARKRSIEAVAAVVDQLGGTKDRLVTGLALSTAAERTPLAAAARAECAAYIDRTDFRPLIPLHPPRSGAWLIVPLVALAFLQLDYAARQRAAQFAADRAQEAVAGTVAQLEQLARQVQKASEQAKDDELKKLAEQLQQSADKLRAETKPEEAPKAALRELSSLEEMMRDLQRQPSPQDEMKELAKALAPLKGMQDVLRALNTDNLAEAQKALDRARQEQKSAPDGQQNDEQVQKALREAVQNLAERRRLSDALQKLADQMNQNGGQSLPQEAMQKLAEMMQKAQNGGKKDGNDQSGAGRQMTIQEMISALENMKFGDGDQEQQGPGAGQDGKGQQVTIQSFSPGKSGDNPQMGDAQLPTGKPGSEHDFGTTKTPFGARNPDQEKGGELALKGQLSKGETLSMMLPGASDQSRAARRYKDLYDAAAASAQDAVQQENIPLGSRFLIRRYFESIRPQE